MDVKDDLSDDNLMNDDDNAQAGLDPFVDHGTKEKNKLNEDENDNNNSGDDLFAAQEGFDLHETRPDGDGDLSSAQLLNSNKSKSDDEDDEKSDKSIFFKGKRPTSAGEPSANVPRRFDVGVSCEVRWIFAMLTMLLFLITLFDSIWIEDSFEAFLHWTNDRAKGLGTVALIFGIFDVSVLMIAGGADIMLALGSGFLFGFEIGASIYIIVAFIASVICFIIGKTLYRDACYRLWSKHEKFRLLDRSIQDFGGWVCFCIVLHLFWFDCFVFACSI